MAERTAALGYLALGKEPTPGSAVTPSIFTPYYKQQMYTDISLTPIQPVYGNKFKTYESVAGHRTHKGSVEVMAEPNTSEYWLDMLLTAGPITGTGPYIHPFTLGADSNSYTMDIGLVSQSVRFFGVKASKLSPTWNKDEMRFTVALSALGSWFGRQITSVSGTTAPYTITLDTTYDPNPTTGLVVGDTLQAGATTSAPSVSGITVATIVNGQQITTNTAVSSLTAGMWLSLAPLSVGLSLLQPFTWPNTVIGFGATAAAALSNATQALQTRLETGLTMDIMHDFESDDGSNRSGAFDPASLIRTVGDYNFKIKKYFDTPADYDAWIQVAKQAAVWRSFSQSQEYEFRFTMNDLRIKTNQTQTESEKVIYQEIDFQGNYSSADSQGMSVEVINNLST